MYFPTVVALRALHLTSLSGSGDLSTRSGCLPFNPLNQSLPGTPLRNGVLICIARQSLPARISNCCRLIPKPHCAASWQRLTSSVSTFSGRAVGLPDLAPDSVSPVNLLDSVVWGTPLWREAARWLIMPAFTADTAVSRSFSA